MSTKILEYLTTYPKTVSFLDGLKHKIDVDSKEGVEQLHVVVKKSFDEMMKIFTEEDLPVKFEHKQPDQIGHGLNLKLKKPWEMHVRMVDLKKGLIGIHAEVEVSRDYLQHLFSQRTPVVYEVEEILKEIPSRIQIWHDKIKKNVNAIVDNYKVKLATPALPVFAWKPMLFVIELLQHFMVGIFQHNSLGYTPRDSALLNSRKTLFQPQDPCLCIHASQVLVE